MMRNRIFFSKIYAECVSALVYNFCGHAAKLDSALVETWKCITWVLLKMVADWQIEARL